MANTKRAIPNQVVAGVDYSLRRIGHRLKRWVIPAVMETKAPVNAIAFSSRLQSFLEQLHGQEGRRGVHLPL